MLKENGRMASEKGYPLLEAVMYWPVVDRKAGNGLQFDG
jgi:hypothetical protein